MAKPMMLETTEKLTLLVDALCFLDNATLDGADLYMLEQSDLWTATTAEDAEAGESDEGEPLLKLNADGIAVLTQGPQCHAVAAVVGAAAALVA
jgi:hypothetical protein